MSRPAVPYRESVDVLALADDLTGALEVGALLAAKGIRSLVSRRAECDVAVPAVTMDTRTRHRPASKARAAVRALARKARRDRIRFLYKKTDSTLRGNIGSEFQALLDCFPDRSLVYVPAYPKMGRTVRQGELFVDGIPLARTAFAADPLNPATEGSIPSVLRRHCRAPILAASGPGELEARLRQAPAGAVIVCDGATDNDLCEVASVVALRLDRCLAAGPAGFAAYWIDRLPLARTGTRQPETARRGLIVSGSQHPQSLEQLRQAENKGLPVFRMEPGLAGQLVDPVVRALADNDWCGLATPGGVGGNPSEMAQRLAEIVRGVLLRQPVDCIAVFGGDTAAAVMDALEVSTLESCGELLDGVPLSRFRFRDARVALATKAGGFGGNDVVLRIREMLRWRG